MNRLSAGLGILALTCDSGIAAAQPAEPTGGDATSTQDAHPDPATGGATDPQPEAKPSTAPAAASAASASKFTWDPYGYLRMQYIFVQNDPNVAFVGRDDGFELQNARIGVRGDYEKRVRYELAIDGAVDERAQENTPDGKLRVGLRDAFADVVVGGGGVFVRGGYFQTWADPTRLVPDTARDFVDRPIESRGMRSTEGWYTPGLPPGRSLGAALRLEPEEAGHVGFEIAVQNGADEFASNNDNDLPAASVAALFRLPEKGFVVAGGRYNPRTVGELPFRQDETDFQGFFGAQVNASAVHLGAGAIIEHTTFGSTGGPAQNSYGAHAELAFRIPASAPVYAGYRFGILDPSSLIVTDRVMEHTLGVSAAVPSLRMRVQLQGTHVMEQADRQLSNTRVQLAAEVAL